MKNIAMIVGVVGLAVLAASLLEESNPVGPTEARAEGDAPKPEYIGVDGCKKCHFQQFMSWKKTSMAKSFETLKPGVAAEAKTKHGLDPEKDYTKDVSCIPCHTTGYGLPGGYPALVDGKGWTEEETERASKRMGVQCESCHGPGSLAAPYKKDHPDYKREDLIKLGLTMPDKDNCAKCHTSQGSPTVPDDYVLDYGELTKDANKIHKHVPLKSAHD